MQQHDETWIRHLAAHGYPDAHPLGAGMEGAVYALHDDLVAKVWGDRSSAELERLRLFYADLSRAGLTFATPYIERLLRVEDRWVTIERRLTGTPLADLDPQRSDRWPAAVECVVDVLDQLRSVADTPTLRGLAVIGEERPFWKGRASWPDALSKLIIRKVARFGDQLRTAVPGFDGMMERLLEWIATLSGSRLSLIHGDMIPANLLVDEELRPVGVLDFGFLRPLAIRCSTRP